jgi:hypothetical protein
LVTLPVYHGVGVVGDTLVSSHLVALASTTSLALWLLPLDLTFSHGPTLIFVADLPRTQTCEAV